MWHVVLRKVDDRQGHSKSISHHPRSEPSLCTYRSGSLRRGAEKAHAMVFVPEEHMPQCSFDRYTYPQYGNLSSGKDPISLRVVGRTHLPGSDQVSADIELPHFTASPQQQTAFHNTRRLEKRSTGHCFHGDSRRLCSLWPRYQSGSPNRTPCFAGRPNRIPVTSPPTQSPRMLRNSIRVRTEHCRHSCTPPPNLSLHSRTYRT